MSINFECFIRRSDIAVKVTGILFADQSIIGPMQYKHGICKLLGVLLEPCYAISQAVK
ncbi:hypothetical protein D3C76_1636500 [compost metagenome]